VKLKIFIAVWLLGLLPLGLAAQGNRWFISIHRDLGIPVGAFADNLGRVMPGFDIAGGQSHRLRHLLFQYGSPADPVGLYLPFLVRVRAAGLGDGGR